MNEGRKEGRKEGREGGREGGRKERVGGRERKKEKEYTVGNKQ